MDWLNVLLLLVAGFMLLHVVCTAIVNRIEQRANRHGQHK